MPNSARIETLQYFFQKNQKQFQKNRPRLNLYVQKGSSTYLRTAGPDISLRTAGPDIFLCAAGTLEVWGRAAAERGEGKARRRHSRRTARAGTAV